MKSGLLTEGVAFFCVIHVTRDWNADGADNADFHGFLFELPRDCTIL